MELFTGKAQEINRQTCGKLKEILLVHEYKQNIESNKQHN
jgi:hypothetical protein